MKKSELWKAYVAKNPSFAGNGNVTLSAAGIRKLFDQTWDIAYEEGEPEEQWNRRNPTPAVEDLMNIFGMK
jgi:hypothetical protein